MKTYRLLCLLLFAVPCLSFARQQPAGHPQTYTFVPETMFPLGGRAIRVTAAFRLAIGPDTVISYLPYFGDARVADYGSNTGPADFSSFKFDYSELKGKKGATIVRIMPKDNDDVRKIELTYFTGSDYADVSIVFNRRQGISYRGRVTVSGADGH